METFRGYVVETVDITGYHTNRLGEYWRDTQTIYVRSDLSGQERTKVLWHELGHALCDILSLDISPTLEEGIVETFARIRTGELFTEALNNTRGWMRACLRSGKSYKPETCSLTNEQKINRVYHYVSLLEEALQHV